MKSFLNRPALAAFAVIPFFALSLEARSSGADPRLTGAPGDADCTNCHGGTANSGPGSLKITLAGVATYTPGVKQRITVQVADPNMRRWGFELTARVDSKPDSAQAGDLASVDSRTFVQCDITGAEAPCPEATTVQFATHTTAGTRNGTTGGVSFEVDWTPPATDVGPITLYAAGNAANGNGNENGDRIYTTSLQLQPAGPSKPSITSVENLGSRAKTVAPNTWININGTGLVGTSKVWTADDLASGKFPESFADVSVTVNNKTAYVQSVSPAKIIALTPADDATGPVEVKVTSAGQTSDASTIELSTYAPAVLTYDGKKVAFNRTDEAALDKANPFPAEPKDPKKAKPGETIILFGTGLGASDPETPAGQLTETEAPVAKAVKVTIGGMEAAIEKAVIIPNLPRLYELRVAVPAALATGDHAVVVEIEGTASRSGEECCFLSVEKPASEEPTTTEEQ